MHDCGASRSLPYPLRLVNDDFHFDAYCIVHRPPIVSHAALLQYVAGENSVAHHFRCGSVACEAVSALVTVASAVEKLGRDGMG